MKKITTLLLFILAIVCNAQITFQKVLGRTGNEGANCIQQTYDSGYIIAATTDALTAGSSDFYIIKTDPAGDTIWTRTLGGISADQANYIIQTSDSGFAVTGISLNSGSGDYDIILIRLNSFGDTLWTREYEGAFRQVNCPNV